MTVLIKSTGEVVDLPKPAALCVISSGLAVAFHNRDDEPLPIIESAALNPLNTMLPKARKRRSKWLSRIQ